MLLDSGGTVFTNALFHVTEAVNQNDLDPALYTLEKSYADYDIDSKEAPQEGYKLYSANYRLPFAMTVASSFASEDLGVTGLTYIISSIRHFREIRNRW